MNYSDALELARTAYREILGREPEAGAAEQIARRLEAGTYSKEGLYTELLGSEEYYNRINRDPRRFVSELYKKILGREPEFDIGGVASHFGVGGDWSRVEYAHQTYQSEEYWRTPRDPWLALAETEQKLEWQQWVIKNGWQVNQLWERFTGSKLSNDELMLIASSAEGSAPYLEKIQKFQYWEPAYEQHVKAYGQAPGKDLLENLMGKYQTPEQYGGWIGAEAETTANLSKIQEMFKTELGQEVGRENVQQYYAGYASSGEFAKNLEEAKRRREYRWKQQESGYQYEEGPAGMRLSSY